MSKSVFFFFASIMLFAGGQLSAVGQNPDQLKMEKEFFETLDRQVEQMATTLNLEDWQIFYVDSIMTHDYKAMQAELDALRNKKVSNQDLYAEVAYKWQDKMDDAFQKVFNEDQWKRYQKNGAARNKKARDKKRAKNGSVSQK